MFTTVVVGADDSPTAAKAVEEALGFARLAGGALHLVTAVASESATPGETPGFADLVQRAGDASVPVETHTGTGDPADVILSTAEDVGADLIVVGSQGMQRRILGSIPNTVAHGAACAVLVVKTD